MHQDSTGRVHSGIASQISFAVGNALRNPDQFRSVPLIGELGRVVKHENKIVRCRYTLTRGLEMARQNVSFADAMIGKKTVGRLRIRPILANERNTLPYVAADPLKQCAKSLAKPRIPKLAPGDFTINPRCCKTGDSIIVPVRAVTQRQAHGAPSLPNQVLSNESQRILPIQVFISRSTPQTHPELWVIESSIVRRRARVRAGSITIAAWVPMHGAILADRCVTANLCDKIFLTSWYGARSSNYWKVLSSFKRSWNAG